jgi:hypothetical protein
MVQGVLCLAGQWVTGLVICLQEYTCVYFRYISLYVLVRRVDVRRVVGFDCGVVAHHWWERG